MSKSLQGSKPVVKSLTIQAASVSFLANAIATGLVVLSGPPAAILIPALLAGSISSLSSLVSIFGRIRATERITK